MKTTQKDFKKSTPDLARQILKERLILQLREQLSYPKACAKVDEILANQLYLKVKRKGPETVETYFKKHQKKCLKKFSNT
jgi:hypothetical protein